MAQLPPKPQRRPRGRPFDARSTKLVLEVTPDDGLKEALSAAAKRTGVGERAIAYAALLHCADRFDLIAQLVIAQRSGGSAP